MGGMTFCKPGDIKPCYDGPPNTEGVGTCQGGTKKCLVDGSAYGQCMGEVTPAAMDDCNAMKDANCDNKLDCACTPNSTMACYDGPAKTENVGTCKGGQATCNAQGTGYGACQGEVTPAAVDDCNTPLDENCDGVVNDLCTCSPNTTQPCYDGPPNTKGVGNCIGGTQTCNLTGTSWGACVGEIVPQPENCALKGDENCDGVACSDLVEAQPVIATLGTPSASVMAQAVDPNKNVYLWGAYGGTIDFGNNVKLSSKGGDSTDYFLVKFDPTFKAAWAKSFSSSKGFVTGPVSICVNFNGYVFAGGSTLGSIDFGGGALTPTGNADIWLASFDGSGTHRWSERFGGTGAATDQIFQLACTSGGNVVASGIYSSSLTFAGVPTMTSAGSFDMFVAQFSANNGQAIFTRSFGDVSGHPAAVQSPTALALDAGDNIYLGVSFTTSLALQTNFLDIGNGDAVIAKLDKSANPVWAKQFGTPSGEQINALAVDSGGNVFFTGGYTGAIDFGGGALNGADDDTVLGKLNPSGNYVWASRFKAPGTNEGLGLRVDSTGAIVVSGSANGAVDFGNGSLMVGGMGDVFLAKFTSGGTALWSKMFGDSAYQGFGGLDVEPMTDDPILSITSNGSVDFGGGAISPGASNQSVMLAKFQP